MIQSMQCPIKYFEDNLIFNSERKKCCAVYKMVGFNYDYKSLESKINILNRLARFIANIGTSAQILMVPVAQDIDRHYERILKSLDKNDVLFRAAESHANQTSLYLKNKLEKNGNANDYTVYIITELSLKESIIREIREYLDFLVSEPLQRIKEAFSLDSINITEREINSFQQLSNDYLRKQKSRMTIKKATPLDTQWLIRRSIYKGLGEFSLRGNEEHMWTPFVDEELRGGEKIIRAKDREILTLCDAEIDVSKGKVLMVKHADEKVSYQTYLAVSHIPDLVFPGNEWALFLQELDLQAEVCIKIDTVEYTESIKNIGKKKKEIKDQMDHISESEDEIPEELYNSMELAAKLEGELKATRSPLTQCSIFICIYADNEKEIEEKIDIIKTLFNDSNFILERPRTDQLKLFMEFFPGTQKYVTDYIQRIPPRTLAGAMPGATRVLGDNLGPYIGTTGELEKNVYLDISRACRENRSASGAFFGTLGGGKSFGANLVFYLAVMYGAFGLVLDPKGERSNWKDDMKEFGDQVNIITLSSEEEDRGKLDPFLIYKDNMEDAAGLAASVLVELLNIQPSTEEHTAIIEAADYVKRQENPCMLKVEEKLRSLDDEDDDGEYRKIGLKLARKIKFLKNLSNAKLLFGTGKEEALSFEKRINVLQIQNLDMPDPKKPREEYSQAEVLSTVLMMPIASFARKFIHSDRKVFKLTLFDEAWALRATTSGKQMMSSLIREGRALNAGCLFISQSTKDADDEGIKTNISYKFCFKAEENNEIKSVLSYLNLESTDENMALVRDLENGECLFQDLDGRVGILKFDAVFGDLIDKTFNTNPDKLNKKEREAI